MSAEDPVAVFDAADEVQAMMYRMVLEEASIDVMEIPYENYWLESAKLDALHSRLLVRPEDEARARELIEAFRAEVARGELVIEETPND
jgi:hypothetical protein